MNASPIDLRLMLLDGLNRRIDEAGVSLHDGRTADALEAFAKARAIAEELESGISEDGGSELARQMKHLYAFLHRLLVWSQLLMQQKSTSWCFSSLAAWSSSLLISSALSAASRCSSHIVVVARA